MSALAPSLQAFFTDRLIGQRDASPNTISAYKTSFRLLVGFAAERTAKAPSTLDIAELDASLIAAFLGHLEAGRHNSVATRNNRLAAIHSLFAYLALHHPEHAATIGRVLAIPPKRSERNVVTYLTDPEVDALLGACNQPTWTGRRDHAMFALTVQTGLRISELAGLRCQDVALGAGANVHTVGKGRKERHTPLVPAIRAVLNAWLAERHGEPTDPLFPTVTGDRLSRDAIERRLARHLGVAAGICPSLRAKHVTTHTLRHTCAMRLLLAGNDVTVIALWLGHEQIETTNIYLHADMTHKQRAIDRTKPLGAKPGRYRPPDPLLAFLEAL
ncbi:MAG TPA: tyrosine-type recombinase/integrase [Acidimicrobiales bacterium]|nr:tyrosine-type recombinase/integrase [Acidimicrobiales bacterium]